MSSLIDPVKMYTFVWVTGFTCVCAAAIPMFMYVMSSVVKYLWERSIMLSVSREEYPDLELPPGTMGYPVIGETVEFLRKRCRFYKDKYTKYGNIYKTHMLGNSTVRVIGAENVKKILFGENTIVTHSWPTSSRLLLGTGSISQSSGYVHKVRRRHVLRAFGLHSLCECVPIIQKQVNQSLKEWTKIKDIYAYPECKKMAFSVAACALVGLNTETTKKGEMHETFYEFLANLMTIPFDLPGFGFRKGMNAKRRLIRDLQKLLPDTNLMPHTPTLRSYYDACEELGTETENEFYEGVIDLLFAGHETIASSTTNCVMLLGKHAHVVQKLRDELKDNNLLTEDGQDDSELSYKTIDDLRYLNYVVKEVLRLCPPVGGGFRKALKSFELGGYLIPKNWTVIYSIRETQQTSPIFQHTEVFDPDRWEKTDLNAERFHYIPFGAGARSCVGKMYAQLVLKIFVMELVRNCEWKLKNEDPEMSYIPVTVATDHLPTSFANRKL